MVRWAAIGLSLAISAAHAAEGPRLALVIGNSTYAGLPPIAACAASVGVVSAALRRAGFAVAERLNVSNGGMGAAITEFGDAVARAPGGAALAYVCGYAVGFDGRVFLLPASASLQRETDALTQGVVGRLLVGTVLNSEARAGLVLLDGVGKPGATAPVPLGALVSPPMTDGKGFAAVHSAVTLPSGPTPLAAAVSAGLAPPNIELRAMLGELRAALQGSPGLAVAVHEPANPTWLVGGPPAPPPAPPPPAPPPPAPATASTVPDPAPTPPAAAPPTKPDAPNEADRRRAQLALQRLGYYSGRIDGVYGADTLAAIRRFQHELGAAMTGRLTTEQAARLLADGR